MKYLVFIFVLFLVSPSISKLIFSDDFNFLDPKKWKHDITMAGGGNGQFQIYQNNRSTSWANNSILNIKPVLTQDKIGSDKVRNGYTYQFWGSSPVEYCTASFNNGCSRTSDGYNYINPVMSAKLTTVQSFHFTFGRLQVRAKIPKGDWLWPAVWMMPRYNQYGTWPASGQIDILESRGNVGYPQSVGGGPEMFVSTLHWGPQPSKNQFQKTHAFYTHPNGTLADDFHVYGMYWDEKQFYTYIDDDSKRVLQVNTSATSYWQRSGITGRQNPWQYSPNKCAPFDSEFYLIINLAVGGTIGYFPDGLGGKPWSDSSPRASAQFYDNKNQWFKTWGPQSTFQIDSVKVWDLDGKEQEKASSLRKQVFDQ